MDELTFVTKLLNFEQYIQNRAMDQTCAETPLLENLTASFRWISPNRTSTESTQTRGLDYDPTRQSIVHYLLNVTT
jgi:hypothetical protein